MKTDMNIRLILTVSAVALIATSCAATKPTSIPAQTQRVDINSTSTASYPKGKSSKAPSLKDALARAEAVKQVAEPKEGEDKLRLPAMQEAATAYGAQAGLAHAAQKIDETLEARAAQLTKTYDFQRLMLQGPDNVMVVPPIISEAQDAWEVSDAGQTLRIADKVYEIVENEEFSAVAPVWQSYLKTDFKPAELPAAILLPKNKSEKEQWNSWVAEGFKLGQAQAEETLEANIARLNRDFTGMVRYKVLVEEKKVNIPRIASANLGTTGTGRDMRQNDRAVKIMEPATLNVRSAEWEASATSKADDGTKVGAEPTAPEVKAETKPKTGPKPAKPRKKPSNPKKPSSTAAPAKANHDVAPTKGGANRF